MSSLPLPFGNRVRLAQVAYEDGANTLDENLVKAVDSAAKKLGTTQSAFTQEALRSALKEVRVKELEARHREGYKHKPVKGLSYS